MIWHFSSFPITNSSGSALNFLNVGTLANGGADVFTGDCGTIINLQMFPFVVYTPLNEADFIGPQGQFGVVATATPQLLVLQVFSHRENTMKEIEVPAAGILELSPSTPT